MKRSAQPDLFGAVAQPRSRRAESAPLYELVLRLRRFGISCYRRGQSHLVDGRQMSSWELARHAEALIEAALDRADRRAEVPA